MTNRYSPKTVLSAAALLTLLASLSLSGCAGSGSTGDAKAPDSAVAQQPATPVTPGPSAGAADQSASATVAAATPPSTAAPKAAPPAATAHPAPSTPPPAPTPAPVAEAPAPPPVKMLTLPEGKRLKFQLDSGLSTATNKVGDTFSGTIDKPVNMSQGSVYVIPAGARIEGSVIELDSAKRVKGLAKIGLKFDTLVLPSGERIAISASLREQAEGTGKRDAATIAGSAAAGAILGRIIGKDSKGAVVGAIVGGAAGTGVVMGTKGKEIEMPAGTPLVIELEQAVDVPEPPPVS